MHNPVFLPKQPYFPSLYSNLQKQNWNQKMKKKKEEKKKKVGSFWKQDRKFLSFHCSTLNRSPIWTLRHPSLPIIVAHLSPISYPLNPI
jgi:hypothetical protein